MVSRYFIGAALLFYIVYQATFSKDRVLDALETAQNWLEQPSVGKDGRIETDLFGRGLSYTIRGASSLSSLVRVTGLQVAQYPRAGQPFNVTVTFQTENALEDTLRGDVDVKLGEIQVYSGQYQICEVLPEYTTSECPLKVGQHSITATIVLPTNIPRARYSVTMKLWDTQNDKTNTMILDANFLFHGTWLEVYENTLEYLKMFLRRAMAVAGGGLVGRPPKPRASGAARPTGARALHADL